MFKKYKAHLIFLVIVMLAAGSFGVKAQSAISAPIPKDAPKKDAKDDAEDEEEVFTDVIPRNKSGVFKDDDAVDYKIKVKSTYKEKQDGKITYDILTDDNKLISSQFFAVHLTHNSSDSYSITIPKQKSGFYRLNVRLNLTSYDDTIRRVFGVSPEKITSSLHRPGDFDQFWKETMAELKRVPPQYKITERKELSTKAKKVYLVEMRSYGNILIRGWLVIPTFGRKFAVHYRVPGYGVEMHPNMDSDDFIAFDLNVRGSGNSQDQIKLNTDIYSTTGLEDRDRYIYRGAYMDCIRGLDFLASHHDLGIDTNRIYVEGGSQGGALGIMTAALDKRVRALSVQVPLYSDIRDTYDISATYKDQVFPFKMFRNYKASHPGYSWDDFYKVFDYYDPQNFAPLVKCPVLMGIGLLDLYCPPRSSMAMFNHLGAEKKEYVTVANTTHEVNFNYFMFQNNWLREQLRVP